jgi:hypothetical protein
MSASEPPQDPNAWNNDDTSAVPVGPEPEPTGAGGSGGPGGWGEARVEPFAIAALVWAIVSIVIPVVGTIVAFVLAAKAADIIRRSRGERTGTQYVTAARIVAGAVLALWIIGGIAFLALRDGDDSNDNVAVPTQPPSTTIAPPTTSTTAPATTTTTHPPATTTTAPPPTVSVVPPPPTAAPTTAPPTLPPTTQGPPPTTEAPPTTAPATTTKPPPVTTTPAQAAAKVQAKALDRIGDSNRGVPNDERVVVSYTPGQDLLITWAINDGNEGEQPTGTPTCTAPPTAPPPTSEPTTTTTTTTLPDSETTTTTTTTLPPGKRTTQQQARYEAKTMLQGLKTQITSLKLDISGVQLVGTYPIEGAGDDDVVQVLYSKATVQGNLPGYLKIFDVPPAEVVQCLNPAFEL